MRKIKKTEKPAAKAKPAPKAKKEGKKGPGVISSIIELISAPKGASVDEIVAVLTKRFPDRDPKGMTATARIQANRNAASKEKTEDRGLVYYGSKK
jgi:hypothetical protein